MTILVVDDSATLRARLVHLLRDVIDDDVVEAGDADEALAFVFAHAPAIVVLDIHMPGRSGLTILPLLKAAPCEPMVIVLTNDATDRHRRECLSRGASFFFDKSSDFERVVEVVRLIRRRSAQSPTT